jgi:hypothetical protein
MSTRVSLDSRVYQAGRKMGFAAVKTGIARGRRLTEHPATP